MIESRKRMVGIFSLKNQILRCVLSPRRRETVESGALPYRAQRCEGLFQHGGVLSTTGYLLLSWQDNSITDSGCCEYSKARALFDVFDWCHALLRWLMYAFKCERLTVIGSFVLDWLYWLRYFREKDM